MKSNTPELLKFKRLQRRLGVPVAHVCGLLELLWISTAKNAPQGDIGRFTNEEIAIGCYWDGDPEVLIECLIECGWLDECDDHRLVVHDWQDHCPSYVKGSLKSQNKDFVKVAKGGAKGGAKPDAKDMAIEGGSEGGANSGGLPSLVKSSQAKPSISEIPKPPRKGMSVPSQEFLSWYAIYPRKVARNAAINAYEKAIGLIQAEHELEHNQAVEWLNEKTTALVPVLLEKDEKYRPHPATWLNAGMYNDEPTQAKGNSQNLWERLLNE